MTLIEFEKPPETANFPDKPLRLQHQLAGHPLLTLPALAKLAGKLEGDRVEFNSGAVSKDQRPEDTPGVDLAPEEIVREIETAGAWLVLKNVESHPDYRGLLEACLVDASRRLGFRSLKEADFGDPQLFIFVASANSTTPFHADYEQNFFIHLDGPKQMCVFDNEDRRFVSQADLETNPGKHRNLRYRDEFENDGELHTFAPGQGLFLPYTWPHWVRTGDAPAISMAVTWKSKTVLRSNKVLFVNAMLRKFGLPQARPGRSPVFDRLKAAAYTVARTLLEPLRKSEASRRFLRGLIFGRKANYYYGKDPAKPA